MAADEREATGTGSAEPLAVGDYVLATKWGDADPGDHWVVGFYDGQRCGRHFVMDGDGNQFRANGFRSAARIPHETGRWLLESAGALEKAPPGAVNLWRMLGIEPSVAEPEPSSAPR